MATLDLAQNAIVLRIVYDGPSAAGKTTSVRALGTSLSRPVVSPKEAGERTLFFDWLDYTGGRFEGYQIRCQVVTVPGQALLARRRAALLKTADAVVHVTHVTQSSLNETIDALRSVMTATQQDDGVAVGVVLQANKQDLGESLHRDALRAAFDRAGLAVGIVESIALRGNGIREAFVLAIRLALDRVKELRSRGALLEGSAAINDADGLLRWVEHEDSSAVEAPAVPVLTAPDLSSVLASEAPHDALDAMLPETDTTRLPDENVATGLVWPPIEGRNWLLDARRDEPERLAHSAIGWVAESARGWRFHSPESARYPRSDLARAALVSWARLHMQHSKLLSSPRVIAVAADGRLGFRLWQMYRKSPSLRERLAEHLDLREGAIIASVVMEHARLLLEAEARVRAASDNAYVRVTLDNVGVVRDDLRFVGLFPPAPVAQPADPLDVLGEFSTVFSDWQVEREVVIGALRQHAQRGSDSMDRAIVAKLETLLL